MPGGVSVTIMKTKIFFFLLILFIPNKIFSQVDTLIYYDVRTKKVEKIGDVNIDSSKSFDFTDWRRIHFHNEYK